MSWMKSSVTSYEVKSIDERIQSRFSNQVGEEIAIFTISVKEAEAYIELLQEAIKEAKKSKWYEED